MSPGGPENDTIDAMAFSERFLGTFKNVKKQKEVSRNDIRIITFLQYPLKHFFKRQFQKLLR